MDNEESLLDRMTEHYLSSSDFNGIPVLVLGIDDTSILRDRLRSLLSNEKITLIFGEVTLNPHIKRLPDEPSSKQLTLLEVSDLKQVCAYPSPSHLSNIIDRNTYKGRPYTEMLALGKAQLDYCSFDLSILESYRNDPRYYYKNNDITGNICIASNFYETDQITEHDQILLESFGFSYDESLNRSVAVFLRYLSKLTPEHQRIWQPKQLQGGYKLHPAYFQIAIVGDFANGISVFRALQKEFQEINKIAEIIGRPVLFRNDYSEDKWPKELGFLIRPTYREFNHFIESLDKVLSDNINKEFFCHEVSYEYEEERTSDGKVIVKDKGTLNILAEWLEKNYSCNELNYIESIISPLKKVRKMRSKSAHANLTDSFNQKYLQEQREIISKVYRAVHSLRLILATHPAAINYSHPATFDNSEIFIV